MESLKTTQEKHRRFHQLVEERRPAYFNDLCRRHADLHIRRRVPQDEAARLRLELDREKARLMAAWQI